MNKIIKTQKKIYVYKKKKKIRHLSSISEMIGEYKKKFKILKRKKKR